MRIFYFLFLICFWLKASILPAIPSEITEHIERDANEIKALVKLGYSEKQKELVLEQYVDGLVSEYRSLLSANTRQEMRMLLEAWLRAASATQEEGPGYKVNEMGSTDLKELSAFINKHRATNRLGFSKIEVDYRGLLIPLFVRNDGDKEVQIVLDGIAKNSEKSPPGLGFGSGPSSLITGAFECLRLTLEPKALEVKIRILNSSYTACPIPQNKPGTFILGLAEELTRSLGKKFISLEDRSTIRCEKNDEATSLARLKIFQTGDTWYGSQGYRFRSDDLKIMNDLRSFSLLRTESELDAKTKQSLEKLKKERLQEVPHFEAKIMRDFRNFESLQAMFDQAVAQFVESTQIPRGTASLGQFFYWLWIKDCARYVALNRFIFANEANSDLRAKKLSKLIPTDLMKQVSSRLKDDIKND